MKYELITKDILRKFHIGKNYVAYDYIIYGIHLIEMDKEVLGHITKTLYIDIACKYKTTSGSVERSIRATIEIMWKNNNTTLIMEIFGEHYLKHRPTNTQFFELLYDYLEERRRGPCEKKCSCPGCMYCMLKWKELTGKEKEDG